MVLDDAELVVVALEALVLLFDLAVVEARRRTRAPAASSGASSTSPAPAAAIAIVKLAPSANQSVGRPMLLTRLPPRFPMLAIVRVEGERGLDRTLTARITVRMARWWDVFRETR